MKMIAKTTQRVAQCHEERETQKQMNVRTDGGELEASQHANMMPGEKSMKRLQLQQHPTPKLQLKLQSQPQPAPKPQSTPTPARQWETVPPRAKIRRAPVGRGADPRPAPTTGSSNMVRRLICKSDESLLLSNKMDQEIASAITCAQFSQKVPAQIRIMKAKRNVQGTITAITHPTATVEMALQNKDIIITAARIVPKGVVHIEENESRDKLQIYTVPLIWYMGKGTESLQTMREEFEEENEGIVIPTQASWQENADTIMERRQNADIGTSSDVFIVMGSRVARGLLMYDIKVTGVS